jgi:hypothetical protein
MTLQVKCFLCINSIHGIAKQTGQKEGIHSHKLAFKNERVRQNRENFQAVPEEPESGLGIRGLIL